MGKRKSKKVEVKKSKVPKLDKEFNCPFCNNVKTVGVRMNHKERLGHLSCRVCGVEYTYRIGKFDEAVDIYSNWIDKCYEVNNLSPEVVVSQPATNKSGTLSGQKGDLELTKDRSGGGLADGVAYPRSTNKLISFSMDDDVNEDDYLNEGGEGILDDSDDFIVNESEGRAKGRREESNRQSSQPSNDEIIEKMKRDLEINKSRKIKEDSGIFDISNITKSSSMPKSSFTVNEDDGLFSD